jgi:WD40 repeat protein
MIMVPGRIAHAAGQQSSASPPHGRQLWLSSVAGGSAAFAIATSPTGGTAFVAGNTSGPGFSTVAYDAATGAELWASQYSSPGSTYDAASAIAASPDGTTVFVAGLAIGPGVKAGYATIAYDSATGAELWERSYSGSRHYAGATALALSPDGRTVFVTGSSGHGRWAEFATIAYSAATGKELWIRTYNASGRRFNVPVAIGASPGGHVLIVTGSGYRGGTGTAFETVAYNAASGRQIWAQRYNHPLKGNDEAHSLVISPTTGTVYVTGASSPTSTGLHTRYVTIAYDIATGRTRWVSSYRRARHGVNSASSVAVDPGGQKVYVTGVSQGATSKADYATIAYSAASGKQLWVRRYNGPGNGRDIPIRVAVSPDGSRVYVTGSSMGAGSNYDYATIAYGAVSGHQLWVSRYNAADGEDLPRAMTVGPNDVVYVTGISAQDQSGDTYDMTTIAYQG